METLCKHNDELTKNVAKLEAIGSTPEAPKNEKSIFETTKMDASTSCNDLFKLDSPLCNQFCFMNAIVEICTQEIATENEQLKQELACLTRT